MQPASTSNPYQAQVVESADPLKLVELLYEGFLRFTRRAIEAVRSRDPEQAHNNILRAYAIIAELQATLDLQQGGSIAANLERCYDYVLGELKEADVAKSSAPLENCLRVIEPLLSVWREAHAPDARAGKTAPQVPRAYSSSEIEPQPAGARGAPPARATLDTLG